MKQLAYTLLFVIGLSSTTLAADSIVPVGAEGFNAVVKPFLRVLDTLTCFVHWHNSAGAYCRVGDASARQ